MGPSAPGSITTRGAWRAWAPRMQSRAALKSLLSARLLQNEAAGSTWEGKVPPLFRLHPLSPVPPRPSRSVLRPFGSSPGIAPPPGRRASRPRPRSRRRSLPIKLSLAFPPRWAVARRKRPGRRDMASGGACGSSPSAERLPPPFPAAEGDADSEGEDIFTGASKPQSPTRQSPVLLSSSSKENGIPVEQDEQDLFADATVELSLDTSQNNQKEPAKVSSPVPLEVAVTTSSRLQPKSYEELEEEEQEDKFELTVGVSDPEKIGDGMNAYVAYKVSTQTSLPMFRSKQFSAKRRFSDFLGLYEKLSEKHTQNGFIVPPPPEKSLIGMTKLKVGKEDSSSAEFLEKRRAALERYLQRIVSHPAMLQDPDVREFLEKEELPRAVGTQTLSGAGILKMFNKATDAVSKMTIKMNESDVWFEEKLQEVECEEQRLRKLHAAVEMLVSHRKELVLNTAQFSKSLAMLGSSEDNTALSRALSQLAEVEEKIEQLHQEQANNDFFLLAELLSDYVRLLAVVRGAFDQRMKTWQRWQDAQTMLQKKRETEARLLWANKPEKLQQAKEEISEWESRTTQYERDFERISAVVRKEVIRFEKEKSRDFRNNVTKYLETLLNSQQQLVKYWEAFLPEAKAIS